MNGQDGKEPLAPQSECRTCGRHTSAKGSFTKKVPPDSWETCFHFDDWTSGLENNSLGAANEESNRRYLHELEPQRLFKRGEKE